jgi:hypothetical protein
MLKRHIFFLFFSLLLLSCNACRKNGGIPPPPDTQIIYPADGDTITNAQISCEWTGIDNAIEFSYKLDSEQWSPWISEESALFFLDEGQHGLSVKSRNEFKRVDPTPDSVTFYIDEISGPALWIKKREMVVPVSLPNSLHVFVEEVTDLMLAYIELDFSTSKLRIDSITPHRDFLERNGGSLQIISEFSDTLPSIKVTLGIVGGSPKGISGTGSLFTVHYILKVTDSTTVSFSSATEIRDTLNVPIGLTGMWSGIIRPEE